MEDLTPRESIKKAEGIQGDALENLGDTYFNPRKNSVAISIVKQEDGNYKLWGQRNGRIIELRAGKPEDVLGEFLTSQ